MKKIKEWTIEEYIKYFPLLGGGITLIVAAIIFRDVSSIIVVSLFAIIAGVVPYFIYRYLRVREITAMEYQLPNFLRDLVEENKSGMTFLRSMESCSRRDYGRLSKEINKMYNQLTWGVPLDEAILSFSNRIKESSIIKRSMNIILEAYRSGGNIVSTMESIASDTAIIKEAEKERKSKMGQQIVVMYMIYFTFIGIVIALTKTLTSFSFGEMSMGAIQVGQPICKQVSSGASKLICSLLYGICNVFGLGAENECYYRSIFLSMIVIQGLSAGLVSGQIGEESVFAGIKHSLIMMGIGFFTYLIIIKIWV